MTKTMKAAVIEKIKEPLVVKQVDIPKIGPEEVLVKIEATGMCHSDVHLARGEWPIQPELPAIPGHEGVGRVVELGSNVKNLKEGDRVGIPWLGTACLDCEFCRKGWETLCLKQKNTGFTLQGTYAEYVPVDARFVGRIPDSVDSFEIAPILCAGVTVFKGLKMTGAEPGEWVAISGIGGLGHVAVQYAVARGYRVIAIDIDDSKLKLAKSLGAEVTVNAKTQDPQEAVMKATGNGCQGVLITAVSARAFEQAMNIVKRGGTLVCNGLPPGCFDLNILQLVLNGITVKGSIVGTRQDLDEAIEWAARGKVKAHIAREPIENVNDIFDRLLKGTVDGRIVCSFN